MIDALVHQVTSSVLQDLRVYYIQKAQYVNH
jgi:hypothetical protein